MEGKMLSWKNAPANTQKVFDYLKDLAEQMRTAPYKEIADAVGNNITARNIGNQLGFIRDKICRKNKLPWINALAVKAQTHLPGDNYFPGKHKPKNIASHWRKMVLKVYTHPWEKIKIE
jgi:hypothetical protein